ncbi:MAG: Crp/Fnr family transcriptional regulator [Gammaproteobacteria bacterium]|nr:Crp/Fnr family transcriptional regulator [Gammaproteobacteria bacterium]
MATKNSSQTVDTAALENIYLFSAFDAAQMNTMAAAAEQVSLAQGDRLFNQGDEIRRFFHLESGRMKLYRLSPEGDEKVIDLVGPGQTFAEAVVFMERAEGYPVNADALEASRLIGFDAATFLGLLRESNESCLRLMGAMSRRLRMHVNEIDRLALQNATSRFIGYILNAASVEGTHGHRVELNAPKNVLASRLSIQPETFSRILSRLAGAGLIRVERQAVILVDVDALRGLLETPN